MGNALRGSLGSGMSGEVVRAGLWANAAEDTVLFEAAYLNVKA